MLESEVICPRCGYTCRDTASYCEACGARLPEIKQNDVAQGGQISGEAQAKQDTESQSAIADESANVTMSEAAEEAQAKTYEESSEEQQQTCLEDAFDVIEAFEGLNRKLDYLSKLFEERIARTDYETATLKKLSDEVQGYRDGLYRKLTLPLIKDMISFRDALTNTISGYGKDDDSVPLNVVEIFANMAQDSLRKHGVTTTVPEIGDEFTTPYHTAISKVPTYEKELHGRIAGVSSDCYQYAGECIQPAMVAVYSFDADSTREETRAEHDGLE